MQKQKRIAKYLFLGLFLTGLVALPTGMICAQGVPGVKTATQTATSPLKNVQGGIKNATQPVKDVNKAIQDITRAPKEVTNEIKRTGSEVKNAQNEVKRTEKSLEKLAGNGDGKDDKNKPAQDSASVQNDPNNIDGKGADGTTRKTAIPADYVPVGSEDASPEVVETKKPVKQEKKELPFYSKDNKTPSGPWPKSEMSKHSTASGGVDLKAGGDENVASDGKNGTSTENETVNGVDEERLVNLDPEFRNANRSTRPDYSGSPARIALEKAEYDLETLQELFKYSNWEGPEREHTVRAVGFALEDLQNAIFEIRRIDPSQSTYRFERRYKEMKAAYKAEIAQ